MIESISYLALALVASDCSNTSVGLVPLRDLGPGLYLGQFQGGLYPNGQNVPPPLHHIEGLGRAQAVVPLDLTGAPDPAGAYVLLSIGMSNATQEFCSQSGNPPCDPWTFAARAAVHPLVDHDGLVIANGAKGGQVIASWDSPDDANYDRVRDEVLMPQGVSEAQVQVVWVKEANAGPVASLPSASADAYAQVEGLGRVARAVRVRYPNARMIYFSSRIYAGYASTTLNPEPYAYESGFAVKWLIEAQIEQMSGAGVDPLAGDLDWNGAAPWLAWGAYLWADGLVPSSVGLTWACADFQSDGTHPAQHGEEKVATMLLQFLLSSPYSAPWFAGGASNDPCDLADLDGSGGVGFNDLTLVLTNWGPCTPPREPCPFDIDGNQFVGFGDLTMVLLEWGPCEPD